MFTIDTCFIKVCPVCKENLNVSKQTNTIHCINSHMVIVFGIFGNTMESVIVAYNYIFEFRLFKTLKVKNSYNKIIMVENDIDLDYFDNFCRNIDSFVKKLELMDDLK